MSPKKTPKKSKSTPRKQPSQKNTNIDDYWATINNGTPNVQDDYWATIDNRIPNQQDDFLADSSPSGDPTTDAPAPANLISFKVDHTRINTRKGMAERIIDGLIGILQSIIAILQSSKRKVKKEDIYTFGSSGVSNSKYFIEQKPNGTKMHDPKSNK